MKRRRGSHASAPSAEKNVLMMKKWTLKMKIMNKIFGWIFQPYIEDDYGAYYHSGVGYTGVTHSPDRYARKKHSGVGYTGVYDE